MRESSFLERVYDGRERGALGEVGCLQVHGVALGFAHRWCESQASCWLRAGALYLAHVREQCPGSTDRWMAAYGMRSCPSEATASGMALVETARRWYRIMRGRGW